MQKKTIIFGGLILSAITLAGCLGSDSPKEPFAIDVCNEYVVYMQCMADSPDVGYTIDDVEGLTSAWQDIEDEEVLRSACTIALSQAVKDMEGFENSCEIPKQASDDNGDLEDVETGNNEETLDDNNTDEENDSTPSDEPDQEIIDAISGQTNTSGVETNSSLENDDAQSASSEISTEDDEIVGAVVQNILATTYP